MYTTLSTVISDKDPRNSAWLGASFLRLSLALALSIMQVTVRFSRFHPNFEGDHLGDGLLSTPSTNFTRRLGSRRLFRVPPCREGTIHLQTSMPSPGFEPRLYGTAVSVTNHYAEWAA
ncbi:hypothetical protein TNCV_1071131 [Trichonephila clavipes]|nr:hypothetical protein TNCV_1071131 [Trichonephila clavipes]